MVKLVDMPDLGSGAARRVGSSPIIRTLKPQDTILVFLRFFYTINIDFQNGSIFSIFLVLNN
jgi:hypothetical protein